MTPYFVSIFVLVTLATIVLSTPVDTEKPAFSCPEDEVYYKCSQIHCYKNCQHLKTPPACPSVSSDCYNPACECKDDYLRGPDGKCIPYKECYPGDNDIAMISLP